MIDIEQYNYHLPEELIRKQGVEPRDNARLFIYDTKTDTIMHSTFKEISRYLPENALMVLNNTKVVPARLFLKKETGGKIEVFVLANEIASYASSDDTEIPVIVDRKCKTGWKLYFPNDDYFEVVRQEENRFFVKLHSDKSLDEILKQFGQTPIPHYLEDNGETSTLQKVKDAREKILRDRYQTIFAQGGASVAAPTASLHFTKQVFLDVAKRNIEFAEVTLNVGLGTFAPLRDEHFQTGSLHKETISIDRDDAYAIRQAKNDKRNVIAVGTTATRALETFAKQNDAQAFVGDTDIFIYPPYQFQIVDIMITNFHLPKSSLMLLVDAFLEHKGARRRIMDLYDIAVREKYAFYSFGDSMLIL